MSCRGGEYNAVDHGLRKGAFRFDPVAERRIDTPRQREHGIFQSPPLVRQVVARDRGKRRQPRSAACHQTGDDKPGRGARDRDRRHVVSDIGIVEQQIARSRVELLALPSP